MKSIQYRQGDVFLEKLAKDIDVTKLESIKRDTGRIVLAYGEVTGHAHAIKTPNAALFFDKENNKFYLLITEKEADLVHEEHSTITLPMGAYEVIRQRQYTPEGIINVQD